MYALYFLQVCYSIILLLNLEPKIQNMKIAVTSQKGGLGKSTLTIILANRLSYLKKARTLIIDRNIPQASVLSNFKTEKTLFETIKSKKLNYEELSKQEALWVKHFEASLVNYGRSRIDVISVDDLPKTIGQMEQLENQYSYIFNDLPGTLENSKLLIEMLDYDVVFIPTEPDLKSGSKSLSTAAALNILKSKMEKKSPVKLQKIIIFFNKVNSCSKQHQKMMQQLYSIAAKKGFVFLCKQDGTPIYIDYRVLYQSDLACSLFFSTEKLLRYTKLDQAILAMIEVLDHLSPNNISHE